MRVVLALVLALVGCANLPDVASGQCGNGVLDDNEDCDVADSRCVACAWRCEPDVACANLPPPRVAAAYRCGVDNLCHAPSGAFATTASGMQPFQVERFVVTDVDRDGIGDAVGLSSTSIVTRLGDPAGKLAEATSIVTPDITGLASVRDVDGDLTQDYILPTGDGVVAFSSLNRVVAPYALAIKLPPPYSLFDVLSAFELDDAHFGVIVAIPGGGIVGAAIDTSRIPPRIQVLTTCDGIVAAGYAPERFQAYDSTPAPGANRSAVITFVTGTNSVPVQCVVGLTVVPGSGVATVASGVLATITPAPASAALVDRDGDHCPSLVAADEGLAAAREYAGTRGAAGALPDCKPLAGPTSLPGFPGAPRAGEKLIGRVPLRPAAAGFAPDALVTTHGIYGLTGAFATLYVSDRALDAARFGDLDADGATDAVVTSSADPDLDVLYRTAAAPTPSFLRRRTATAAPPAQIVVDDFDGNGASDIVYSETVGSGDRMVAVYGDPTRALVPIDAGEFYGVRAVAPIHLVASNSPNNLLAGLAVADARPPPDHVAIDLLYGSPERSLLPFLDPQADHASIFRSIVGGSFTSPGAVDFVAFETPTDPLAPPVTSLTLLAGGGPGQIDLAMPTTVQAVAGIGSCEAGQLAFCLDDARLVAWPSGDHDTVVMLDPRTKQALVYDPAILFTCGMNSEAPCALDAAPLALTPAPLLGGTIAQPPVAFDANGDGTDDLVVGSSSGVAWCTVGSPFACTDLTAQLPDLDGTCTAAVVGRVDPAGTPALVLVCGSELYRFSHDADGDHATALATLTFAPREVELGDVTGDRLDDLLVTGVVDGVTTLFVYPQRASREAPP